MRTRSGILALLFLLSLSSISRADMFFWDNLLKVADQAGKELARGEDRKEILGRLDLAIEENSKSKDHCLRLAKRLRTDLSDSLAKTAARPKGESDLAGPQEQGLMETTLPLHLIAHNWSSLGSFAKENPHDPMAPVLSTGRSSIESLLPMLRDRSPTRSYRGAFFGVPKIPRVCDMALLTIEFFSKCRFLPSTGQLFHELSPEDREKTIRHMEKWWAENKAKTVAAGIRAHLPHASVSSKVCMAKNLLDLADKKGNPDREFALDVLRTIVRENRGSVAFAARSLAEFDDFSPVDVLYARLKKSIDKPGRAHGDGVVSYLTTYGTRREWELLYTLAEKEIEQGLDVGAATVWPVLANCNKARSSPFAIPGVALALTQTKLTGSRSGRGGSQPFSRADLAIEHLEKLTGKDFGYCCDDSAEKRSAAIRKAHKWWTTEGKKKYTFDYAETLIKKRANKSINHDKQ